MGYIDGLCLACSVWVGGIIILLIYFTLLYYPLSLILTTRMPLFPSPRLHQSPKILWEGTWSIDCVL